MIYHLMKDELRRDESTKLKPYLDCCGKPWRECTCTPKYKGKLTIGTGRNLDDVGISSEEDDHLLTNNIAECMQSLDMALPWWKNLSDVRQRALFNMCFNMGLHRLMGFTNMLIALRTGDYQTASDEALNSAWAKQVGSRAQRIAVQIATG